MTRRLVSFILAALLLNLVALRPAYAGSREEERARFADKVKASIHKLGVGEAARVKVKLRDGKKLEGYISAAGDEAFTVNDSKTGVTAAVPYPQVKSVKGNNLSTGAKIAIGAGIAAAIIFLIVWKVVVDDD